MGGGEAGREGEGWEREGREGYDEGGTEGKNRLRKGLELGWS